MNDKQDKRIDFIFMMMIFLILLIIGMWRSMVDIKDTVEDMKETVEEIRYNDGKGLIKTINEVSKNNTVKNE